ncbi:MAG: hypothetical protein P8Y71_05955 [Pseudolabrys sp.]
MRLWPTGTNDSGSTVTLNGNAVVADTATTWHYVLSSAEIDAFGQGAETLTAVATDAAGNTTTVTHDISVDTLAPAALSAVLASDTGADGGDQNTSNGQVNVSGLEDGATWQYSTDGGTNWVDGSATSFTLTEGVYTDVQVKQFDAAGNEGPPFDLGAVTIDQTPPTAVATVTALSDDTGTAGDFITGVALQTVSGTYSGTLGNGELIQVSADGTTWVNATAVSGMWSASGVTLSAGSGTLMVQTIDLAGNTMAGNGQSYYLGQTIFWTGATDHDWANAANWDPDPVPGPVDDAVIGVDRYGQAVTGAVVIATGTAIEVHSLSLSNGAELDLDNTTVSGGEYIFGGGFSQAAANNSVLLSGIGIGDLSGNSAQTITLTIVASNGTLDFATLAAAVSTYNLTGVTGEGTDTLQFTGALSDVSAALSNGILYAPGDTSSNLTMTMDDGSGGTAFRVMSVDTTNAASPVVALTDTNGMISNNGGLIDVAAGGATLSTDIVFNDLGTVQVEGGQTLVLNYSGILGGTVNDGGTIEVALNSTFNGATVNLGNNGQSGGQVLIDSGQKLTLRGGATVSGGEYIFGGGFAQAAANNSVLFSGIGIADLDGTADPLTKQVTLTIVASSGTLDFVTMNGLTIVNNLDGTGGTLEVTGSLSDASAALSNGTIYSPTGTSNTLTMTMDDGSGGTAFRVMSVDTSVAGSPDFQLTDTNGMISNNGGLIDVAAGGATLSSDIVFNYLGTVHVGGGQTLILNHSGILDGTVNDGGTIEVALNSTFSGATVNLGNNGQSGGQVLIDSGQKLTLRDGATVSGGEYIFGGGFAQAQAADTEVLLSGIGIADLDGTADPLTKQVTLTIVATARLIS